MCTCDGCAFLTNLTLDQIYKTKFVTTFKLSQPFDEHNIGIILHSFPISVITHNNI